MSSPLLEFKDVSIVYGSKGRQVKALDSVNLRLDEGERVAFVGESGAGKTTLARCLAGLIRPQSGRILFRGKDINTLSGKALREFRKSVQIVFQDPYDAMNPHQNVREYLSIPLRFLNGMSSKAELDEACSRLLEMVGLPVELLGKLPHQLSGGQKQRVCIARALASDPKFIVADEPSSMLDASASAGVLNLFRELAVTKNMGYAVITHNIAVAAYLCDTIHVMYAGKIVESASTGNLISRPRHPYSHLLLKYAPRTLSRLDLSSSNLDLEGDIEFDPWKVRGCRFRPLCTRAVKECSLEFPTPTRDEDGQVLCYNPIVY